MKKILTRLSSILLLITIVISAISMSGHVFAQTDRQNQNNIVDVETDENQSTKVILQSSEGSLEKTLQENNENYEKVGDDTYIVDYESVNEATKAVYDIYSNDDSVAANEDALFFTMTEDGTVTLYAQWKKLTDLKVGVTVSGNMGSRVKDFEFSTAFPACFQNKKFTIIKADGSRETVTIGADGAVKFSLRHGETFTITDLDTEQITAIKNLTDRCVNESDYSAEGYVTRHSASVESDGTLRVDFNNAKNSGVPTGLHLGDASLWMTIVGVLGIIGIAISNFLKKKE